MLEGKWMFIREVVLLIILGLMSMEDLRKRQIRRGWLLALGMIGGGIAFAGKEIGSLTYFIRFVPGIACVFIAWLTREQLGFGDAFLFLAMGWYLAVTELVDLCLIAFSIAGVVALILLVVGKKSKTFELPLIPVVFVSRFFMLCFR